MNAEALLVLNTSAIVKALFEKRALLKSPQKATALLQMSKKKKVDTRVKARFCVWGISRMVGRT